MLATLFASYDKLTGENVCTVADSSLRITAVDFEIPTMLIGALNVVTNIAYLISATLLFQRRLYDPFSWAVAVFIVSALYHTCSAFDVCFSISPLTWQMLDHISAHISISRAFLLVSNYDIVREGHANTLRPQNSAMYHTRAMPRKLNYVLIKTRFADLARAAYTFVVIAASLTTFGTPFEYLIVIGTGLFIVALSFVIYWDMKVVGLKKRYDWRALLAAAVFVSISGIIFVLPGDHGDLGHPIWHLTSAYGQALIIYGATKHLRVFSIASLLPYPA